MNELICRKWLRCRIAGVVCNHGHPHEEISTACFSDRCDKYSHALKIKRFADHGCSCVGVEKLVEESNGKV